MNTLLRSFAALVSLVVTLQVSATSWHDDSHYVTLGQRTGYYIVRSGSSLSHQLDIDGAPTADTADPFNHGYGADALAFRFNRAGILTAPPAYAVQATPNAAHTAWTSSIRQSRGLARIRSRSFSPRAIALFD